MKARLIAAAVLIPVLLLVVLLLIILCLLVLLILDHLLCIDIILLGIHIPRIPQQRLLKSIHSSLPVLLSNSHITKIEIIICCRL